MGHSPLVDTDYAAAQPARRDNATLGPSDSSDSGSDVAVIADAGAADPGLPVDKALGDDQLRPLLPAGDSDSGGSGERRSAGGDGGGPDGADIGTDRVIELAADEDYDDDEDPDLAFIDALEAAVPPPGQPNPEPDPPDDPDGPDAPDTDEEREQRKPGRD